MVNSDKDNTILIVDDEPLVREIIRRRLIKQGYLCYEAGSAGEAMDIMQANQPRLIVMDTMLPGKTGIELLPEIRASYPDTAVIMSTAVVDSRTIIDCMRGGAQDYITKPFDLEQIVQSVDKVLQMKRLELEIKEYQERLEHAVDEQKQQIRKIIMASIESLVYDLEAKDRYTAGHSRRVTHIAVSMGEELGLSPGELDDLRWGALLHDVGKIAVDAAIQNKPDRLTTGEYRHMMTHTSVGVGIVKPVASPAVIAIVAHHHDHYDGTGLDQTTRGEEIPLGARIVALADSFDAMTSDRPYRCAMSFEQSIAEVKRCAGSQFDPIVVAAFLKVVADLHVWEGRACNVYSV